MQAEGFAAAKLLERVVENETYKDENERIRERQHYKNIYKDIWEYCWKHMIDHENGAWYRIRYSNLIWFEGYKVRLLTEVTHNKFKLIMTSIHTSYFLQDSR